MYCDIAPATFWVILLPDTASAKSVLMKACLSYTILLAQSRTAATTSCLASIWMTDTSLTTPCFSNCGLLLGVHVVARPISMKRSWPSAVGVSLQGSRKNIWMTGRSSWAANQDAALLWPITVAFCSAGQLPSHCYCLGMMGPPAIGWKCWELSTWLAE